MAVLYRWYCQDGEHNVHGPFETEKEAWQVIRLPEEEQIRQNRDNQKHSCVWRETVAVSDDGEDHVMWTPPPSRLLYVARVPWTLLPFYWASSETSGEEAIRLLTKMMAGHQTPLAPGDKIEVHVYTWHATSMTVYTVEEKSK